MSKKVRKKAKFSINLKSLVLMMTPFLVAGLLTVGWLVYEYLPIEAQSVETKESLVDRQEKLEQNIKNIDSRFDDPKVVINPYGISPLSAVVLFKTDKPETPSLTVVGKDRLTTFSHTFEKSVEHRLPVYGLYPNHENKVQIKIGNKTKELTIKTEALPDKFPEKVDVTAKKDKLTNDLYFLANSSNDSKTMAYDVNGDVRWYLTDKYGWEVKRSHKTGKFFVSTERINKEPYFNTGLYEIDLLGKVYREYTIPGGYHHDVFEKKNGNLIIATYSDDKDRKTVEDVVVELDRETGKTVKTIDFTKIWPMDTGKSLAWSASDWFHNNSVWLDEDRDILLLSGRHQDAVVALDYKTDEIKYIIGSPDDWSENMQKHFLKPIGEEFEWQWQQHAAKFLPNKDILLFDNGNHKSKNEDNEVPAEKSYSRAVIYRVDEKKRTIEQVWQYGKERGSEYYSPYISEVDHLGKNHYLVHSGGVNYKDGKPTNKPASIAEADKLRSYTTELLDGEVIFEIVNNQNHYRAEKMPAYISTDHSVQLGRAVRIGQPAKSHPVGDIPIDKSRPVNGKYARHKIKLTKEYDRLVMTGTFDKKDEVRLALVDGSGKQLTYKFVVDPGMNSQALCVDIMNHKHETSGETKRATNYVNQTGLSGEYKIYISIKNKIYDTGAKVTF